MPRNVQVVDLEDLRDDSLLCKYRAIGHDFDENFGVDLPDGERTHYASAIMSFKCGRCGREKFIYFDRNMQRMGQPYYRNPTDFQHTRRLDHHAIELEILSRGLMTTDLDPDVADRAHKALIELEKMTGSMNGKSARKKAAK